MIVLPKRGGKQLLLLADKIKNLRLQKGITQTELAKTLGLTRSSVNGWEMGLSVPSTQFIAELADIFSVSTGYLLGVENENAVCVDGLTEKEISTVLSVIECFKDKKKTD
jgi:transcriptional regulator with XRE-family HTH domain